MRIGQLFRYARPYSAVQPEVDGLPNYFHATFTSGCSLPLLEAGINKIAKVKSPEGMRRPFIPISSSPHKVGKQETPWQDAFSVDRGHIRYFGDKTAGKDPASSEGNALLLEQFDVHRISSNSVCSTMSAGGVWTTGILRQERLLLLFSPPVFPGCDRKPRRHRRRFRVWRRQHRAATLWNGNAADGPAPAVVKNMRHFMRDAVHERILLGEYSMEM